jgi:hypothetical protein
VPWPLRRRRERLRAATHDGPRPPHTGAVRRWRRFARRSCVRARWNYRASAGSLHGCSILIRLQGMGEQTVDLLSTAVSGVQRASLRHAPGFSKPGTRSGLRHLAAVHRPRTAGASSPAEARRASRTTISAASSSSLGLPFSTRRWYRDRSSLMSTFCPCFGSVGRHCGGFPCLRQGKSASFVRNMASERISAVRVSRGSMTSSTSPRSAA